MGGSILKANKQGWEFIYFITKHFVDALNVKSSEMGTERSLGHQVKSYLWNCLDLKHITNLLLKAKDEAHHTRERWADKLKHMSGIMKYTFCLSFCVLGHWECLHLWGSPLLISICSTLDVLVRYCNYRNYYSMSHATVSSGWILVTLLYICYIPYLAVTLDNKI